MGNEILVTYKMIMFLKDYIQKYIKKFVKNTVWHCDKNIQNMHREKYVVE